MRNGESIIGLVKSLAEQVKLLIRQEFELAKTELTEKASSFAAKGITLAIGGVVAYAGALVFLGGLGLLVAYAFQKLGLDAFLAGFLGFAIIGLLVIGAGGVLVMKGLKALKTESLAPDRTIETLQQLKGPSAPENEPGRESPEPEQTSKQLAVSVHATEQELAETLEELTSRLTLAHLKQQATLEVHEHPYRWGLVAAAGGLAASYFVTRKLSSSDS